MPSIVCSGERQVLGPSSRFHLSLDELDEFMRHLEETAYSAQNLQAHDRLGQLLTRLDSGLGCDVDEGPHMVRPAAARLGYPRLPGQDLAFIYSFTKLHRPTPAKH